MSIRVVHKSLSLALFQLSPTTLILLSLFLFHPKAKSQQLIFSDSTLNLFGDPVAKFGDIDLQDCSSNHIDGALRKAFDIAKTSSGNVFYYSLNGFGGYGLCLKIQAMGGSWCEDTTYDLYGLMQGLTCDESNHLYTAGRGIVKMKDFIFYPEPVYLGDLPPDLTCQGDITYRKGKFYMVATGNKLVEVNMKHPEQSQVIMEFPSWVLPVHGLTTVQVGCDSTVTYAVGRGFGFHSEIYTLDIDNLTISNYCALPRAITGLGNETECALPPCALFVDLDHDNSSIAFWGNYCANPFCQGPVAVTDTDVVILSMANTLDSLELVLSGSLDGTAEFLETSIANGNLTVLGNGSGGINFLNNGSATLTDFEAALKSVLYQNTASAQTFGMRQVRVTGWSEGEASILSTADLPLSNEVLKTTATATPPTCHGSQDGSLLAQTSAGTAPYSYEWQAGGTDSLLTGLAAGTYHVTVSDARGCVERDSFTLGEPPLLTASIEYFGLPAICHQSAVLTAVPVGGTPPYAYNWGNGATTTTYNTDLGAGDYPLTVTDGNGCTATTSYTISAGQPVSIQQQATICEGQTLVWQGQVLSADTTVCLSYTLPNGCDSSVCLALTVNPLPQLQITVDGTLCNGNEAELSVGSGFELVEWSTGAVGPSINVGVEGSYVATVTNSFGCSASTSAVIAPALAFNLVVADPSCFGRSDGGIFIDPMSGTPPYQFSLNGTDFTADGIFENLPAGDYLPSLKDATGCELGNQVELTEPPPLSISAGPDASILVGESIELNATASPSNLSVTWQPTDFLDCAVCASPTATPPYSIEYTATVSFGNGCEASDTVSVTVEESGAYYVPTAFSPNKDGINDWFTVFGGRSVARIVSMEIYDRKGGLAFSVADVPANQEEKGWNGKIGEEEAQSGVFTYKLLLEFTGGKVETVTGTVLLLR